MKQARWARNPEVQTNLPVRPVAGCWDLVGAAYVQEHLAQSWGP